MPLPPQKPVMETINMVLGDIPPAEEGYIAIFPAWHNNPKCCARFLMEVIGPGGCPPVLCTLDIQEATIFPTYEAAAAEALKAVPMAGGGGDESAVRIAHVRRRPPFEVLDHKPIGILDRLAEVISDDA